MATFAQQRDKLRREQQARRSKAAQTSADKRRTQAENLVKKGASWVTGAKGTVLFSPWATPWTTKQRFFQAPPTLTPATRASATSEVWQTFQNRLKGLQQRSFEQDTWIKWTPKTAAQLLTTQQEVEDEAAALQLSRKKWEEEALELWEEMKVETVAAKQQAEVTKQRKEARAFLERQKAAARSQLSVSPDEVQRNPALADSAVGRIDSAAATTESKLDIQKIRIQSSLDALARARVTWDIKAMEAATLEVQAWRKALKDTNRQAISDVSSLITGLESEEQIEALAAQFWVEEATVELLAEQAQLKGKTQEAKDKIASQKTSFTNFNNLDTEQVAKISEAQSLQWDKAMWLPEGSVAQFVLWSQEALELKWDEAAAKLLELRANLSIKQSELGIKQSELWIKQFEAWLTDLPASTANVNTSLSVWDMTKFKGKTNADWSVITKPAVEWSETSEIWDWNIVLWSDFVWWLDMDWKGWQDLLAMSAIDWWEVLWIDKEWRSDFWVNVVVKDNMWRKWRFSHLQKWSINALKEWQQVSKGMNIWKIWNTWNVFPKPSAWDLESWSHVDISVTDWGKFIAAANVEALINAWKQNARWLWKEKFSQMEKIKKDFTWDNLVKSFEEQVVQWTNLLTSLSDISWPWDMAAVFQFMKSLDPRSVVRETEFEAAQKTSWVVDMTTAKIQKLIDWEFLTKGQRQDFKKLATAYMLNVSKVYDKKWNDTFNTMKIQNIPWTFMPTSMSETLKQLLRENARKESVDPDTSKTKQELIDSLSDTLSNAEFFRSWPINPNLIEEE